MKLYDVVGCEPLRIDDGYLEATESTVLRNDATIGEYLIRNEITVLYVYFLHE